MLRTGSDEQQIHDQFLDNLSDFLNQYLSGSVTSRVVTGTGTGRKQLRLSTSIAGATQNLLLDIGVDPNIINPITEEPALKLFTREKTSAWYINPLLQAEIGEETAGQTIGSKQILIEYTFYSGKASLGEYIRYSRSTFEEIIETGIAKGASWGDSFTRTLMEGVYVGPEENRNYLIPPGAQLQTSMTAGLESLFMASSISIAANTGNILKQLSFAQRNALLRDILDLTRTSGNVSGKVVDYIGSEFPGQQTIDLFKLFHQRGYVMFKPDQTTERLFPLIRDYNPETNQVYMLRPELKGFSLGMLSTRAMTKPLGSEGRPLLPQEIGNDVLDLNKAKYVTLNAVLPGEPGPRTDVGVWGLTTMGYPAAGGGVSYGPAFSDIEGWGIDKSKPLTISSNVQEFEQNIENLKINKNIFQRVGGGHQPILLGTYMGKRMKLSTTSGAFVPNTLDIQIPYAQNDEGMGSIYDKDTGLGEPFFNTGAGYTSLAERIKNSILNQLAPLPKSLSGNWKSAHAQQLAEKDYESRLARAQEARSGLASRINIGFSSNISDVSLYLRGSQLTEMTAAGFQKTGFTESPEDVFLNVKPGGRKNKARVGVLTGEIKQTAGYFALSFGLLNKATQSALLEDYAQNFVTDAAEQARLRQLSSINIRSSKPFDMMSLGKAGTSQAEAWDVIRDIYQKIFLQVGTNDFLTNQRNQTNLEKYGMGWYNTGAKESIPLGQWEAEEWRQWRTGVISYFSFAKVE